MQSLHAGVVVLVDLPQDVMQEIMQVAQESAAKVVNDVAQENKVALQFSESPYLPHISLAFVSPDKLNNEQIKEKYAALLPNFKKIAQGADSIDLSEAVKSPEVNLWPGRFEMECGGSKKKNYQNLVLALGASAALSTLAEQVRGSIETEYDITQRFPFSAHLTLGRICEKDDQPLSPELLASLKETLEKKIGSEVQELPEVKVRKFMLKGDDVMSDPDFEFELK